MENVYDMGKVFRNEGISPKHSPEFTIIEFMCAYSDYNDVATVTEEMFRDVAQRALGRTVIKRNGEDIDLAKPWRRVTMRELILERFGLDFMESTREQLAEVLDEPIDPAATWAEVVADIYSEKIESTINQPTHVFDFPLEPFPITKRHPVHPELAEHFDAVIGGIELVSGDTELNDPVDQWQRFVDQRKRRMIDDADVPHPNDEEYARAIEYGYSPTAGGGMGVDRLVMILTERDTLREVIPFPIVRDIDEPSQARSRPRRVAACRAGRNADRRPGQRADRRADHRVGRAQHHAPARRRRRRRARGAAAERARRPRPGAQRARPRDRLLARQRDAPDQQIPQQIAEAVSASELDLCTLDLAEDAACASACARSARRGCARSPRASTSAARCASGSAKHPRRCATCSPPPATSTRTSCTPRPSPRPAATSSR